MTSAILRKIAVTAAAVAALSGTVACSTAPRVPLAHAPLDTHGDLEPMYDALGERFMIWQVGKTDPQQAPVKVLMGKAYAAMIAGQDALAAGDFRAAAAWNTALRRAAGAAMALMKSP